MDRMTMRKVAFRCATAGLVLAVLVLGGCGKEEQEAPPAPAAAEPEGRGQIVTGTGIEMVLLPAGQFTMGDDGGEEDERPARTVRVDAFYMDKCEVTQEAYEALMGKNPSKAKAPDKPVEQVSWYNATRYCNMRSLREGLEPCYDADTLDCDFSASGYRLPTEAEWEYACRAGTGTKYSFGNGPADLGRYGWFEGNSGNATHPVGRKQANPWGLHDVHGNVAEWCHDAYDDAYYGVAPGENPTGPPAGDERVLRGGSWQSSEDVCRSSARYSDAPGFADVCFGYDAYGFRCVKAATGAGAR